MALSLLAPSTRIANTARTLSIALPLVFLACTASPALADSVTFGFSTCGVGPQPTGSCSESVVNAPNGSSATVTVTSPLSAGQTVILPGAGIPTNGLGLYADFTGSGALSAGQQFTLAYDFFVDRGSSQASSLSYDAGFELRTGECVASGANCYDVDATGLIPTGTGLYEVKGSQRFTIPGTTLGGVSIGLQVYDPLATVSLFSVTGGSVSLTTGILPAATTVTPEPASLILTATGLMLTARKRRHGLRS